MPVVVDYTPAPLVGQLASNAGNFATQQAVNDQGFRQQQLDQQAAAQAQQYALAQQQHQIQQQQQQTEAQRYAAQLAQQAAIRQAQFAQQQQFEQDKNTNFNAGLQHQYSRDQGNQDFRYDKLNADGTYRDASLDQRGQHYADQNDIAQGNLSVRQDAQRSRGDYQQGMLAVAQARANATAQAIASRLAGGDPSKALQLRQQVEQRIATDQDLKQTSSYLQNLYLQEAHLTQQLNDPTVPQEDKNALRTQVSVLRRQQTLVAGQLQNKALSKIMSPPSAAAAPNPLGGAGNIGIGGGYGGASPDLRRGPLDATGLTPSQFPPQGGPAYGPPSDTGPESGFSVNGPQSSSGLPPEAEDLMHQMIAAGHDDDTIKNTLQQQFGLGE